MPYLIVQRLYGDMLIDVRQVRLPMRRVAQMITTMTACPGQVATAEGALWMGVHNDDGVLIHGPVCFRHDAAHAALIQTGCAPRKARDLLSDRYAKWWIRRYHR